MKHFKADKQSQPVELLQWMLNNLHKGLTKGKKGKQSIVHDCFQGKLKVTTFPLEREVANKSAEEMVKAGLGESVETPFLMLTLDVPPAPLFKDAHQRSIIPQIPLVVLLKKYDGRTTTMDVRMGRRKQYAIISLPNYLILHVKRFTKNYFFVEKNPTIVNFPVKSLDMKEYCAPEALKDGKGTKYDLVANITHEGKPDEGTYKVHIKHEGTGQWYEMYDLNIQEAIPQYIAISEAYLAIFRRRLE